MAGACPDCGRPLDRRRKPVESITGRRICADCNDTTLGLAAGVLSNPTAPAAALATEGWFRRLRNRRAHPRP
jgi:hypothetical protein